MTDSRIGKRAELHPATDSWMRGDRYGEIVSVSKAARSFIDPRDPRNGHTFRIKMDKTADQVHAVVTHIAFFKEAVHAALDQHAGHDSSVQGHGVDVAAGKFNIRETRSQPLQERAFVRTEKIIDAFEIKQEYAGLRHQHFKQIGNRVADDVLIVPRYDVRLGNVQA